MPNFAPKNPSSRLTPTLVVAAVAKSGINSPFNKRRPQASLQLIIRQAAFLKKLFHQRVIRCCHRLDQFRVHRLGLLRQVRPLPRVAVLLPMPPVS